MGIFKKQSNRDFEEHNQEIKAVWDSFRSKQPIRIPLIGGVSIRYYLNMCRRNCRDYFLNPKTMMDYQLQLQKFNRSNITGDQPAGLPEEWDGILVDFQNVCEAGWLGCEIVYPEDDMPWSKPILKKDKTKLYNLKIPQSHDNLMKRMIEYYEFFKEKSKNMMFEERKIKPPIFPSSTQGPFTLAADLRGCTELCLDIYEDPEYVHHLLDFTTNAIIFYLKRCYRLIGKDYHSNGWAFSDDSIALLSGEKYKEFVLPFHIKLINTFSQENAPNFMHLCGPAEQLGRILYSELNIRDFETSFPTDFQKLKTEMGADVSFRRTVHPQFLLDKTESQIIEETKQLIEPEIRENRRLILRTFNVIAPGTPIENLRVMYYTIKKYGYYR